MVIQLVENDNAKCEFHEGVSLKDHHQKKRNDDGIIIEGLTKDKRRMRLHITDPNNNDTSGMAAEDNTMSLSSFDDDCSTLSSHSSKADQNENFPLNNNGSKKRRTSAKHSTGAYDNDSAAAVSRPCSSTSSLMAPMSSSTTISITSSSGARKRRMMEEDDEVEEEEEELADDEDELLGEEEMMLMEEEEMLEEEDELLKRRGMDEFEADEDESAAGSSSGSHRASGGTSSIEKRHRCEICGKGFPYMSILESHKRCHTGEKPFLCHFCDKRFAQKATLQVHERTHTGERPYKCKYCDKTFAQYGTKTVHEKSAHLGIRNYKCPKCAKCLSSPSALYTHKKTHGDKSFQCHFCSKTFTLKNYLKLHIKQVHEHNERKHQCRFCAKTFAYAGSLQVHVRTHTGERPYTCKFCPKAFASQGNLQSHERTHTGERPYACVYCGRSFIQKSQLTAHEATHSFGSCASSSVGNGEFADRNVGPSAAGSPLTASENGDESPTLRYSHKEERHAAMTPLNGVAGISSLELLSTAATSLSGHQYSSEKPSTVLSNNNNDRKQLNNNNEFVCKFCGKRYAYASSLYVHTRLHTGERPFRCNFCDKSFTNQGNMQVHQRVHTGEKPYKCDACGKSYAQKVGLKIHQEQCQSYLNRRGSVMTVGTNESSSIDSSPISVNGQDAILLDPLMEEIGEKVRFQQQQQQQQQQNHLLESESNVYAQQSGRIASANLLPSTTTTFNPLMPNAHSLDLLGSIAAAAVSQPQQLNDVCTTTATSSSPHSTSVAPIVAQLYGGLQQHQQPSVNAPSFDLVRSPPSSNTDYCNTNASNQFMLNSTSPLSSVGGGSTTQSSPNLIALVLEQLEHQHSRHQQQQLQQLNALKALLDLSAPSASSNVATIPASGNNNNSGDMLSSLINKLLASASASSPSVSSTPTTQPLLTQLIGGTASQQFLPQPQPLYVQPQAQQANQSLLYQQPQQQLSIDQLLAASQQQKQLVTNPLLLGNSPTFYNASQFEHLIGGGMMEQQKSLSHSQPQQLTASAAAAHLQLVAAAEALNDLSKQNHLPAHHHRLPVVSSHILSTPSS